MDFSQTLLVIFAAFVAGVLFVFAKQGGNRNGLIELIKSERERARALEDLLRQCLDMRLDDTPGSRLEALAKQRELIKSQIAALELEVAKHGGVALAPTIMLTKLSLLEDSLKDIEMQIDAYHFTYPEGKE